jgi:precorrin-8X/cobalt-precorrin-8 methylmutase
VPHVYETDGAAIYLRSFATIRAEADLARFTPEEEVVVVRMIHAAGMVGLEAHVAFTPGMSIAARAALEGGAPILCDVRMVSEGITRTRLPADNAVICTLQDGLSVWRKRWAIHGLRRRWSYGGRIWPGRWWRLAMRRRRCFIC